MRLKFTIVFLLLISIAYGQKSTLVKNINARAQELEHSLNKAEDSIFFKCGRTIFEVVLFKEDFERVVRVRKNEAKIPIADLPIGKYIVEILLRDKLIVLTLIRHEIIDVPSNEILTTADQPSELLGGENKTKTTKLAVAGKKAPPKKIIKKAKKRPVKKPVITSSPTILYWVEYKINTGQNTLKTQKFGDQNTIDQMIRKIEVDKKTKTGRLNELIVWRVFDTSKFIEHRKANKTNYHALPSESFNTEPYYKTTDQIDN
ncbi:hypothetical protein HNV08_05020 [Winogradskyella eckloniae]|uniref:hypothetical protein n=1 Tax=Winogradskyella eckloniae TaxID=1089306 RepID=UPI0015632E74|nr:hypothetical protein [Winogradskyella eckloniae]NRD19400.1 hypothetical protein [Winogradskyella eckloniae]